MFIKRNGTVVISSVILLSLMSFLGMILFKMTRNNNELSYLYNFDGDVYNLEESEENELQKFMKDFNNSYNEEDEFFKEGFYKTTSSSSIRYEINNKLILKTKKENGKYRDREILYKIKKEKIILVPTYKFTDY